jgi:hypothetical protein
MAVKDGFQRSIVHISCNKTNVALAGLATWMSTKTDNPWLILQPAILTAIPVSTEWSVA